MGSKLLDRQAGTFAKKKDRIESKGISRGVRCAFSVENPQGVEKYVAPKIAAFVRPCFEAIGGHCGASSRRELRERHASEDRAKRQMQRSGRHRGLGTIA